MKTDLSPAGTAARLSAILVLLLGQLSLAACSGEERVYLDIDAACRAVTAKDPYAGTENLAQDAAALEAELAEPDNVIGVTEARELHADTLLRHGKNAEAVQQLEAALELALSAGAPPDRVNRIRRALGVAHIRTGEADHCIAMHNPASCLFPVEAGGVWNDPEGAVRAAEQFLAFLQERPEDEDVRWLLNVAHMVAGTHPEGVPDRFLIERSIFSSDQPIGRFRDVATDLGVDTFSLAGGAIMDDFDRDGYLDLFTTTMDCCGQARYYHNRGDGTFEDWTGRANLEGQLGGLNCVQADYDDDGDLDVLILRGGWLGKTFGAQRNSLLRQEEDGTFTDVTMEAGLGELANPTQVGAFGDYDGDGDLDLFIGNEYRPCELFRNEGDGTFTDVAARAGVEGNSDCPVKGAVWGDYDNDGDPDLYVSNYGQPNHLYRNEGDGTFAEVAGELGVRATDDELTVREGDDAPRPDPLLAVRGKDLTLRGASDVTFATWWFDMDNDGWLDLYVGGFGSSLSDYAGDQLGSPVAVRRHLRIYRNDGAGGFRDVSREMDVDDIHLPMGANFGDVDNDGYMDFYLGTGKPPFDFLVPNVLYRNVDGERFANVTSTAGVGHLQKGHGVAFGDLDNDGDQDIFAQMGGFYPADQFRDALFENPGNDNRWLTVSLRGVQSNHFGIGARIAVTVETPRGLREVHVRANSGGSFGANSLRQEIGLGDAVRIVRLEVFWPTSGVRQGFEDVPLDRFVRVTEDSPELELLERAAVRLGS